MPTALERTGDFSQSLDNNGAPIPQLLGSNHAPAVPGQPDSGGSSVSTGLALLNRYPLPNVQQARRDQLQLRSRATEGREPDPAASLRIDYQLSPQLRVTWKYSGQRGRPITTPGLIEGFTDVQTPYPYITNYATNVNYMINSTTFLEGTWGFIRNELTGGNEGGVLVNESTNRLKDLPGFPMLYPNAGTGRPTTTTTYWK